MKNIYTYGNKQKNKKGSKGGKGSVYDYRPKGKEDTKLRARIHDRYLEMRDDELRKEAEKQWDLGEKMYRLWAPEQDDRDWRADVRLPDGFSAVQSHMQETVNQRPRPVIKGVGSNDAPLEQFATSVFNYAMDVTDFDQESFKARNAAAIRGTAFTLEEYRYETRKVKMPKSFKDGEMQYEEKEIVDFDDVYTRYIENRAAFFDPGAEDQKYGNDCIHREIIGYDVFCEMYKDKAGFKDTDKVEPAGSLPQNVGYFKYAEDINEKEVELLHYWNKLTDTYGVLANNVLIRNTPLPSMHKELPMDIWTFYPVPGQVYGMGIPYIIHTLVEERRSIRNMSLDRQKMQIAKMFLVNDLYDISEDDLTPRPHGLIRVNTNGLPLNQSIMPLEYGDIPGSALRIDEMLKEDERRAHGMDDRPAIQQGGTATEAAIVKESAQQRINLINTLSNWNTLIRLGRKKWSNIQFFYQGKRMEKVYQDNKLKDMEVYRTIKVKGYEYNIVGDPEKGEPTQLESLKIPGWSSFRMDPAYARYLEQNYDLVMDAEADPIISKAIQRAQVSEMFQLLSANPLFTRFLDLEKSIERYVTINGEQPADWMVGGAATREQQEMMALQENDIFLNMESSGKIFALPGTPGATEAHNGVHLQFMETDAFKQLSQPVQQAFMDHVQQEIESNPALAAAAGMGGGEEAAGGQGGENVAPGMPGGPNVMEASAGMAGAAAPVAGGDITAAMPPMM